MPVVARAALAPLAAAALPAVALRQATTWIGAQPYVPLTSGTASGTGWLLQ